MYYYDVVGYSSSDVTSGALFKSKGEHLFSLCVRLRENENVCNSGQGEAQRWKCKRLKPDGGQAYSRSSDWPATVRSVSYIMYCMVCCKGRGLTEARRRIHVLEDEFTFYTLDAHRGWFIQSERCKGCFHSAFHPKWTSKVTSEQSRARLYFWWKW